MQKGTSADELRQWRMAPYLDAVLRQRLSRFPIRLSAQLLRCPAPHALSRRKAPAVPLSLCPADMGTLRLINENALAGAQGAARAGAQQDARARAAGAAARRAGDGAAAAAASSAHAVRPLPSLPLLSANARSVPSTLDLLIF